MKITLPGKQHNANSGGKIKNTKKGGKWSGIASRPGMKKFKV